MSILAENWTSDFITTNKVKLHYVTQGEGPLILMLHGFPEFWYSWRYQIPEFAQAYKVVAVDLRGYNESDKPKELSAYSIKELILDVKGLIEGLGYEECVLVGHDWGGFIAWNFAYCYPQMLSKLIVLNLPHPTKFKQGLGTIQQLLKSWYIFFFQVPLLPELLLQADDYRTVGEAFTKMVINKNTFSEADLNAYKDAAAKRGALTAMVNYYRNLFPSLFATQQTQALLNVPTLMIWGENDLALGQELTYGTEEYVRDFQIRYIPNCSHWVQQERPELVNQYIWEFLNAEPMGE
ncbi:Epoxide hydrolase 1 [Planktothrix tepida]|uniref:AB hydrolase-1 domain-containing protein n=1 Tax=Planktothrix tepida PCC 9214 TaxID=671072 RepID=A0A1J1LMZ5_9CYAN|nr:alpha/beta hydrolase [Planktothrix tepida]CAD5980121.1 Epoxide hydrolase 1 [Planktothrix tepida]CUR33590.1 conserved hypothetical protein [Planktothrix tepida PCC 9214]